MNTMTHEVRVGMSVYWVKTWNVDDGHRWEGHGQSGWAKGSRYEAVKAARAVLQSSEGQ